jgi:High-temperature-induced dauer-formation protein
MFRDDHEGVASVALQVLNVLLQYNQHHFHNQAQQQFQRQLFLQQQQQLQYQLQQQQQQQLAQHSPLQQSRSFQQLHSQVSPFPEPNGHTDAQPPTQDLETQRAQLRDSGTLTPQHVHAQQLLAHSLQLQRAQQQLLAAQQPQHSEQTQNLVLNMLADLRRNKDFQLVIDSFIRLMANPIAATAARLPYSVKQLEWHHHILMLFWHLIEDNKVQSHRGEESEGM